MPMMMGGRGKPKGRGKGRGKDKLIKGGRGSAMDRRRVLRKKACKFCLDRLERVDFRDTGRLLKFTSERGKILPRRISGNCAKHQRQLASAVKRSRSIALMPYVTAE